MKVIGTTVCTPINPRKIEKELRPVKIVNGITPDDAGNITIPAVYLVTLNDANNFTQQPYSDILAAYQAGYAVQCDYRGYRLPLKAVMDDWCTFSGVVDATLMTVLVRTNGNTIIYDHSLAKTTDIPTKVSQLENDSGYLTEAPVSSVNGQTGDVIVPGPVEVKAEKQADGSYEATLKPVQILNAINNGSTVYCKLGEKILQMAYKTPSLCVFSGIYDDHLHTVSISTTDVEVSDTPLTSGSGDAGNAVLFTPQELTSEQKAQARKNIGSSNVFYKSKTLEKATYGFNIGLPTTFGNIVQLNVHITLGKVEQEFQLVSMYGGSTAGVMKINAGNSVGVNFYCLQGSRYDNIIYFSHSVTQNTVESGAAVPVTAANQPRFTAPPNTNNIYYYSNTDGVLIPEGTIIRVWGVCI